MKKVFVLFTVVMLMAVMAWEKQSGKPVESEFLLDNVEALAAAMNMSRSSLHRKRIFRLYLILLTVSLGYI